MRCLFVGLGRIGQRHLRCLRALRGERDEVIAVRPRRDGREIGDDLRPTGDEGWLDRLGVRVLGDLDAALAERPELVFVTSPNAQHLAPARAALEIGAHLFVEKPLGHTWQGVPALVALAERSGRVAMVGFQLRQHPAFVVLDAWRRAELLGRLLHLRAEVGEYAPSFHAFEDYRASYVGSEAAGGGVVRSQIHEIDLMLACAGPPRRVFAVGGQLSSLDVDAEDVASALFEIECGDGRVIPASVHQDFVRRPTRRRLELVGERGVVEWDLAAARLRRWDESGALAEDHDFAELPRRAPFERQIAALFACIEQGARPAVDLRQWAQSLAVALAVRESLARGVPVEPRRLS